jgi:hypothetical protein
MPPTTQRPTKIFRDPFNVTTGVWRVPYRSASWDRASCPPQRFESVLVDACNIPSVVLLLPISDDPLRLAFYYGRGALLTPTYFLVVTASPCGTRDTDMVNGRGDGRVNTTS